MQSLKHYLLDCTLCLLYLVQVRTVPVETTVVTLDQLKVQPPKTEEVNSVEASMRLDAIASAGGYRLPLDQVHARHLHAFMLLEIGCNGACSLYQAVTKAQAEIASIQSSYVTGSFLSQASALQTIAHHTTATPAALPKGKLALAWVHMRHQHDHHHTV